MKFFKKIFGKPPKQNQEMLEKIRARFDNFMYVLRSNNSTLKIISGLMEKLRNGEPFDREYIEEATGRINSNVSKMIENMVELGGSEYERLNDILGDIMRNINFIISNRLDIEKDKYIIPLDELTKESISRAGGKNSRLGEIKATLDLPVPAGFAISAWAYQKFISENGLQEKISRELEDIDINNYPQLEQRSRKIREMIYNATTPADISEAILSAFDDLTRKHPGNYVSMRSSAIGEDSAFSFAGQYKTFLGVRREDLLERYREVIAAKYAPKAIFYYISNSLDESELAMSVSCMMMVDARCAGVVYTRDPVNPRSGRMIVNSIYGLGKNLVSGVVDPDVFYIDRQNGRITDTFISEKKEMLRIDTDGSLYQDHVHGPDRRRPSISETRVRELGKYASRLEAHFHHSLDIEWAIDRSGTIYILQARPLKMVELPEDLRGPAIDYSRHNVVASGGTTVYPGAGSGRICIVRNRDDISRVMPGSVIASPNPFPSLITALEQAGALITRTGSIASHLATIAREYGVPSIFGIKDFSSLEEGMEVTVDAANRYVLDGIEEELVRDLRQSKKPYRYEPRFGKLKKILGYLSPLNLIQPTDDNFYIERCETIHDITRFAHQKALEELYNSYERIITGGGVGIRLDSKIPLRLDLIYIDEPPEKLNEKKINDDNLISEPMQAFWNGVMCEGWPTPLPSGIKGISSARAGRPGRDVRHVWSKRSFAVLHKQFMLLSLKMGYHFSTIEAICSSDSAKNYIKMQFKDGGASLGRRKRRIRLITSVLAHYGFENHSRGDFLDTALYHEDADGIKEKLFVLGRLAMMTKQLDMALSNDQITEWYTKDILRRLETASGAASR
jgi:pyruvate,water dikinase